MPDTWKKATIILTATAALAVAGGAGAVAGDLIGTSDLKDDAVTAAKLSEDSVRWGKHLRPKTKAKIKSFAGADGLDGAAGADGATGPAGIAGQQGPRGPAGPVGATGAPGGELYAWGAYGTDWGETAFEGFYQVSPASGEDLVINQPGVYLVTMQALFYDSSFPVAVLGEVGGFENELDLLTQPGVCFNLFIPTCEITYPVFLDEEESVSLPLYASMESGCGECPPPPPPVAQVSVFRMTSDAPDTSAYDELIAEYYEYNAPEKHGLKELRRFLAKH